MLLDILRHSTTTSDLTRLFVHLGYHAADMPHANDAVIIARWRGFFVVACTHVTDPRETVRGLARRMGAAGERGLAVSVGAGSIAIAAPRPGRAGTTKPILIDVDRPSPVALAQLRALAPTRSRTGLEHGLHVAEVLSTEAVSERFFRSFRRIWVRMADSLDPRVPVSDRRLVTLHSLIRVLFLYFVQVKGWLAGDPGYLRSLLDRTLADSGDFHRRALDPLFFGTLNRSAAERTAEDGADLPYLNGGMFRRHPIEQRVGPVHFTDELWIAAFEDLFDRYHFCVREAERVDAVAPDMLGRVFERLMDADERSVTGSFFTPEHIVHDMVREALIAVLVGTGGLPQNLAERIVRQECVGPTERARGDVALQRLRLLDPAVGSGAFLLGALDVLTDVTIPNGAAVDALRRWSLRRRILRQNLFGIDVNPVAVRLAELRLWLAVITDDPATTVPAIEPLPNLDAVVRQGNALMDPLGAARAHGSLGPVRVAGLVRQVAEARTRLFDARGQETNRAAQALHRREHALARALLSQASRSCEAALSELQAVSRGRDLFGKRSGLTPTQRARQRAVRDDLRALERAMAALDDGALPFFAFEVQTADVLRTGGFDLVIGNPPWVRAERLPPHERRMLQRRFALWRSGGTRGFRHLPDLSVAFAARALELVAPGGVVALLLPSKVSSAGYAEALRRHLATETMIICLHRVPDRDATRFGATTYPLAVIVRSADAQPAHHVKLQLGAGESVVQRTLDQPGPWILLPNRTRDALEELMQSGTPLVDVATPHLGVKTGADGLLVGEPTGSEGRMAQVTLPAVGTVALERDVLRPAVRGRDVTSFQVALRRVVLWGYARHGRPRPTLPARATAFVRLHRDTLEARADYRGGPLWTLFRAEPAFAPHRLIWRDIARRPAAAVLDEVADDAIPLNTCYVATFPDRLTALAAAAVLNSTWAEALITVTADEARGGYRRCNARVMGAIPLPTDHGARYHLAELARHAHHTSRWSHADLDTSVAKALGLSGSVQTRLRSIVTDRG